MLPNKFMQPGKHNFEDLSGIRVHKVVHKILLMTDEWDWIDEVAQADLGCGWAIEHNNEQLPAVWFHAVLLKYPLQKVPVH